MCTFLAEVLKKKLIKDVAPLFPKDLHLFFFIIIWHRLYKMDVQDECLLKIFAPFFK